MEPSYHIYLNMLPPSNINFSYSKLLLVHSPHAEILSLSMLQPSACTPSLTIFSKTFKTMTLVTLSNKRGWICICGSVNHTTNMKEDQLHKWEHVFVDLHITYEYATTFQYQVFIFNKLQLALSYTQTWFLQAESPSLLQCCSLAIQFYWRELHKFLLTIHLLYFSSDQLNACYFSPLTKRYLE